MINNHWHRIDVTFERSGKSVVYIDGINYPDWLLRILPERLFKCVHLSLLRWRRLEGCSDRGLK